MRRVRVSQLSAQVCRARPGAAFAFRQPFHTSLRTQSTIAPSADLTSLSESVSEEHEHREHILQPLPSPAPERALQSAKLAALHARLSLSKQIPLQTLARALVSPTADSNANFNNTNLAFLGSTIINYHVFEYLLCKWPRLPTSMLYEVLRAFAGPESLYHVARGWGIDSAAAPGEEVDPGLLQWKAIVDQSIASKWGHVRAEEERDDNYRRGLSSRIVLDDAFGDLVRKPEQVEISAAQLEHQAFSSAAQAVVGAIYTHCGREAAKAFVKSHILTRQIDPSVMFHFKQPTRELSMLCAREGFTAPIARLESETGRLSRTPVFIVGIYSGNEKLGEGAGPSLNVARNKASMNALKAWYLYSPGNKVRVPSDMLEEGAKPWKAPHIDIGEIV